MCAQASRSGRESIPGFRCTTRSDAGECRPGVVSEHGEGRKSPSVSSRVGSIFTNLLSLLRNRATPKTQSALREAMQEKLSPVAIVSSVWKRTVFLFDGTQRTPLEMEGPSTVDGGQLDRFLFKLRGLSRT